MICFKVVIRAIYLCYDIIFLSSIIVSYKQEREKRNGWRQLDEYRIKKIYVAIMKKIELLQNEYYDAFKQN